MRGCGKREGASGVTAWRENGNRGELTRTRRHSGSLLLQGGATPLFIASYSGHLEAVKALIEKRADVKAKAHVSSTSGRQYTLAHEWAQSRTHSTTSGADIADRTCMCACAHRFRARDEGRGDSKETIT
jgi:predicted LPLAT superfamily acyltransferase